MPVRPAAAGVAKHQLMFSYGTEICVMTLWTFEAVTVDWPARIAAERLVIRTWAINQWAPIASAPWTLASIKSWQFTASPPIKSTDDVIVGGTVGSLSGTTAAPPFIAGVIALRTEAVGAGVRGINGRLFHPGLGMAQIAAGALNITTATATALDTRYTALRDAMQDGAGGTAQGTLSVVSFFDGGTREVPVVRVVPLVKAVDHILVPERMAVQRRRRVRQQSYPLGS